MTREMLDAPLVSDAARVVVVDDHQMFADSVARVLERAPDIEVVAIASTCAEAVAIVLELRPDVAVVDFQLPDGDGATLAARIREVSPNTQIVILTGLNDHRVAVAAIEAGCAAFLTKDKAIDDLISAVRNVHAGEAYIPAAILSELLPRLRTSYRRVGSDLTKREREVLQLLALGMGNDAIAGRLVLSKHTVRNHVQNILGKLGAHSKLEAVAIALREGLVQHPSEPVR